jgi:hypothetical protein
MAWPDMVAVHGVRVVLIDTVLKSEGRHLLKTDPKDSGGIFTLDGIESATRMRATEAFTCDGRAALQ